MLWVKIVTLSCYTLEHNTLLKLFLYFTSLFLIKGIHRALCTNNWLLTFHCTDITEILMSITDRYWFQDVTDN